MVKNVSSLLGDLKNERGAFLRSALVESLNNGMATTFDSKKHFDTLKKQ